MTELPHSSPPRDPQVYPESPNAIPDAEETTRSQTGFRKSVWFAFKAIEIRLRFIAILVGIGLAIGYWDTIQNYWDRWTRPAAGAGASLSNDSEFYCPMHPSVVRDKPDAGGAIPKCPICGMPLSQRKKGEQALLPEGILSRVQISPYRIELAGINTVEAQQRPLMLEVRTVGYVTVDERKLSRLVVRVAGYVEKLYVNESFAQVAEGEPLAEIYSPELYSAAQELLIARTGANSQLATIAREKLKLLGVADQEIDEIVRTGKADSRLVIRSPHGGHVFEKRIVEGDHVDAGQMLFEVADLSTVWIEGEVYEKDAGMLQPGQAIEATVDAIPGRMFEGQLSIVHPHVEAATRTVRVRFELPNPGHMLRPGMFATVTLKSPMLDMEPFRTQLAAQKMGTGATDTITDPAASNAEVTPNANHKSKMNDESLIAMQKICPVTGAKLGSMGKPIRQNIQGRTVFLCCAGCEDKLAAKPDYYIGRLSTVSDAGVLAVPERSVIDTGNLKIVYVEREPGLFEGVAVTLGPFSGGYYPVIDGLLPGDRVAAAGAFLVDAETRLNPAAASAYFGASGTPPTGGAASKVNPTRASKSNSATSSPTFSAKELANLAKLGSADRRQAEQQRTCPITDLPLGSMGTPYKLDVAGQRLFLCCEQCKGEVDKDPQTALSKIQQRSISSGGKP